MSTSYDIFLSYHSRDRAAVKVIAETLINRGINPFFDKWNLTPGQPWLTEIEEALHSSKAFAIFIGREGIGPVQVAEMRAVMNRKFREQGYPSIPVLLPGANPADRYHLPAFLAQQTWVDLRSGLENREELERFIAQISIEAKPEATVMLCSAKKNQVDKGMLLRTLVHLEEEDLVYLGEITGIRRAELRHNGIKTIAVSLVNRAEVLGLLEVLQSNLVIEYPALSHQKGIS
ncbi:MAG: toll/interleukin-1 receptor domain-containing protein [Bacillota bacterium]|nr:toll/interleukin-1 receptor domain-containing protein [Bacillota bacterium]